MLTCDEARALRMRWLSGDAPEAKVPLATHAASCPRCGKALGAQLARDDADREAFSPWAAAVAAARPDPAFADRVLARLPRTASGRPVPPPPAPTERELNLRQVEASRRRRYVRIWGAALAASLLLVAGSWALICLVRSRRPLAEVVAVSGSPEASRLPWSGWGPLAAGDHLPAGASLRTDGTALVRLRLPDGSLVDLGPSSRMELEGPRAARLERGRAWVSASKSEAPWVVKTREGSVRTLGTVFSVELKEAQR